MSEQKYNYEELAGHLGILLEDIYKLHDIIEISQNGLNIAKIMPKASEMLMRINPETGDKKKHDNILRVSEIAKKEIDSGFPFLNSQASLMMYSYLEGAIKRFVITFFKHNELENIKELSNIKISIAEYINLDENDRYDYLFQQYEKNLTSGIQYGLTRFENLLSPIGLSGEVKSDISKNIFELSQIRNNILHRGGIADRHLIKSCPWLNYNNGDKISVDKSSNEKYHKAITDYIIVLAVRLGEIKGIDVSDYKK